jgi:hypothetical protein
MITTAIGAVLVGGGVTAAVFLALTDTSLTTAIVAGFAAFFAVIVGFGLLGLALTRVADRREARRQGITLGPVGDDAIAMVKPAPAPSLDEEIEQWLRAYGKKGGK